MVDEGHLFPSVIARQVCQLIPGLVAGVSTSAMANNFASSWNPLRSRRDLGCAFGGSHWGRD